MEFICIKEFKSFKLKQKLPNVLILPDYAMDKYDAQTRVTYNMLGLSYHSSFMICQFWPYFFDFLISFATVVKNKDSAF